MADFIEDGGSAFPGWFKQERAGEITYSDTPGMSLRDWFAGQAMERFKFGGYARSQIEKTRSAEAAYRIADAMLAARSLSPRELRDRAMLDIKTPEWRSPRGSPEATE